MIKSTSLQPLFDCFDKKPIRWITELSFALQKNRQIIHRYIKELVARGEIESIGEWAHTRYKRTKSIAWNQKQTVTPAYYFDYAQSQLLDKYFFKFAPNGELLTGNNGFVRRCLERKMDPSQKVDVFCKLANYIESQKNPCGLLDVSASFREHIEGSAMDQLFFADQYKWMEFGRGKLAELTFYAKDTQSIKLISQSINAISNQLECLIHTSKIDAVAFAPHSRKRAIQLLKELQKRLNIQWLPIIKLVKYAPYGTIIAQKSLKTREQRIQNAKQTILIDDPRGLDRYKKVLLIDDFVWSGATLNETAKKLKAAGIIQVIGFAWVGNANLSYEVINEI